MIVVGEKFEIIMSRWKDSRKFKMNVECIYVSEQVLRFKITGGQERNVHGKTFDRKRPINGR